MNPPLILGLRALPATTPSVFVKIRSPNDGPSPPWSSPWSEKPAKVTTPNLLESSSPKFRPKYQIHPLSGVGSVVSSRDKKCEQQFLMQLCLEETRAMTLNNKYLNIQDKTTITKERRLNINKNNKNTEISVHCLNFRELKGH